MTGLVSFSLYGTDPDDVYHRGAIRNAEMYAEIRPDWRLRFYLGQSVPKRIAFLIEEVGNSEIVWMVGEQDRRSTYWRFLAIKTGGYDFYLLRDTDSRPLARENAAVDEWLASGKEFHVMRDHPRHGAPILAGMWGVTELGASKIRPRMPDHLKTNYYQVDQDWLKHHVWPVAQESVLQHVDCEWSFGTPTAPFSVPRKDFDYVAECRNGDDTLRFPDHRLEIAIRGYRAEI